MAAIELTRIPLRQLEQLPAGDSNVTYASSYKWQSRLLIPKKELLDTLHEEHSISRMWFVVLVLLGVVVVEGILMLTRHVITRRRRLAARGLI